MATDAGGGLIAELAKMAQDPAIDERTYRRLMLVAMADLQGQMRELKSQIKRDWTPVIVAVAVALMTVATVWLKP